PHAERRASDIDAATTMPKGAAAFAAPARALAKAPVKPIFEPEPGGDDDDDDGLAIGEVSRVVKLADIAKMGRSTGAQPRLGRTASHAKLPAGDVLPGAPPPDAFGPAPMLPGAMPGLLGNQPVPSESVVAAAPYRAHRRGMIMLLSAAGVLLAGVVVAVVLLVQGNGDDEPSQLGRQHDFDTSRPDDPNPRPRNPIEAVASTGAMGSAAVPHPRPRPVQIQRQPEPPPELPGAGRLKADEIEDMAAKQGDGTRRCYMRAQKGALGLDVGDIKKIDVTLTVDKDGVVSDVQLSDHAGDNFGKCLISRIRGWKFRTSPGGTFKFALAFSSG
ncbi:MAG: hypothetical protein ACM31C_05200, partial [Acidobacteriota bacterium]